MSTSGALRTSLHCVSDFDADLIKRNGFLERGILVINVDDPALTCAERLVLQQIGERLHGKRKASQLTRVEDGRRW